MDNNTIKIIGLIGSLRKDSFNKALMEEAVRICPSGSEIEILDIIFPLFNQDLENEPPEIVRSAKEKVRKCSAILIATPEYNYSIPGVLKNAIDWISRPYGDNSFEGKPVAMMSASIGMIGGARAQYHLRQSFVFLDMHPLNLPEVMVPYAQEKISGGMVNDIKTKEMIKRLLDDLIDWTDKIRKINRT